MDEEIKESRLFRSDNILKKYNAYEIKNIAFLYFLALTAMKESFDSAPWAQEYLFKTFRRGKNFNNVNRSDTDLYWALYIIDNKAHDKINPKYKEENKTELEKLSINTNLMILWARDNIKGKGTASLDRRFLMTLEKGLRIDVADYQSIRRLVSNWNMLSDGQRKVVCTRLLFAMRKHMRLSEIYPHFYDFVKNNKYLIKDVDDPEKSDSSKMSDVMRNLAVGAGIAGVGGLMSIKSGVDDVRAFRERLKGYFKESIQETTSAGSVAAVVMPLGGEIQKRPNDYYAKRGNRKKKKKKN